MSRAVSLSACLIVRDAEADLDWCLQSFKDEVDEIVIVDTGSNDATKTIARRYAKHVYTYEWQDDFSAARNFALSKARGTWIFFPDSDECLAGEKGALRRAVRGAEGLGEKSLSILRHEVDEEGHPAGMPDNPAVRLLRRGGGLAYHDAVHEYLAYPDGVAPAAPLVPSDEVFLYHRGYAPARKAAKNQRNLAILERMEREGTRKLYLHYYLAGLYSNLGRYDDVRREAELSLTARERPGQGALELWRNYMTALEKLGRTRELHELCVRAVEEVPELPDAYARLAVDAMNRGDFREGERLLIEAQQREAAFSEVCPYDADTFHQALQQVESLLVACRNELGEGDAVASAEKEMAFVEQAGTVTVPKEPEVAEEDKARMRVAKAFAAIVPPAAANVVLFGCGRGEAGGLLLRQNPAMRIFGFTATRADAVRAGRVLAAAFVGTPETAELELYGLSEVDCIAYDVASCGLFTTSSLRRHVMALAADGQIVLRFPSGGAGAVSKITSTLEQVGFESVLVLRHEDDIVVRAARQKVTSCSVQTLIGESIVTERIRVDDPNDVLATVPGFVMHADTAGVSTQLAGQMDTSIVIRQRKSYDSLENGLKSVAFLREHHHILLYEIDDNPIRWAEKDREMRNLDFVGAHAVQVSTPALAEVIRSYNPHVFVFENQLRELPAVRDYEAEARARGGRITLFFGALNREDDYDDILPVLNAAFRKYGSQLQIRVLADAQFFQQIETKHKEFVADPKLHGGRFVPYETYQSVLHTADISLLPLHNTEFNRTKSDLKFIESAAHGAVVLASPTVYERTVVDGCTGCIYHTPEEFAEKLQHLIEDKVYRHAIAAAAWQYVKDHRLLSQHYLERAEAYRWIIAHHEELDRELGERLEKLEKSEH